MPTHRLIFVNRTPYRVLESSVPIQDGDLLRGFRCDLHSRLADKLIEDAEDEDQATLALRLVYGLAQETFFALLFAVLQAPDAPTAWLLLYRNKDLLELISAFQNGQHFPSRITCPDSGSWHELAVMLMPEQIAQTPAYRQRAEKLGSFWAKWAAEQLNESHRAEFNSLKHGLRIAKASPFLAIDGQQLEGEGHGSWFATAQVRLSDVALGLCMRSWSAKALHSRIKLMSSSSSNLIEILKLIHAPTDDRRLVFDLPTADELEAAKLGKKPLSTFNVRPTLEAIPSARRLKYEEAYPEYSRVAGSLRIGGTPEGDDNEGAR